MNTDSRVLEFEQSEQAATVRRLNDAFRRSLAGGRVMLTAGVAALAQERQVAIIRAVQAFDQFDPNNDPHGEHDLGAIEIGGERFFWKLDTYDRSLRLRSPDPADPAVTVRVITIMRADEY